MCGRCAHISVQPEDVKPEGKDARECPVAPGHRVSRRAWLSLLAVSSSAIVASCSSSSGGYSSGSSSSSSGDLDERVAVLDALKMESRREDISRNPAIVPETLSASTQRSTWLNQKLRVFSGRGPFAFTSDFGWRPLGGSNDFHGGIDMTAAAGTPVLAALSGLVVFRRSAGRNGGVVIYDRKGAQQTYFHVEPNRGLQVGDWVRKGQRIGRLADWGSNTHLHFSMHITGRSSNPNDRIDEVAVDPIYVLNRIGRL